MRRMLCFVAAAVVMWGHVPTASADPVLITSGVIGFTDEPGLFEIHGDGLDLKGGWAPELTNGTFWYDRCRNGCAPRTSVDFGTTSYKFSESFLDVTVSGTVGGIVYPEVFLQGLLTFTGPRVMLPAFDTGHRFVEGSFTFSGPISGFLDRSLTGPPAFSTDIAGQGAARVWIEPIGPSPSYLVTDIDYVPAAAIPEPSTLLMSASGLLGLMVAVRTRLGGRSRLA